MRDLPDCFSENHLKNVFDVHMRVEKSVLFVKIHGHRGGQGPGPGPRGRAGGPPGWGRPGIILVTGAA